jgi:hypothetical protein
MEHSIAPGRQTLTRMGPSTAPPFAAYHVFDHTRRRTGPLLHFAKIFLSLWIYNLVPQSNHRSENTLLIGAVVPFTFIVIMPINHKLLAPGRDLASAETRGLLERWANLHAVRSLLSLVASVLFLWQLLVS